MSLKYLIYESTLKNMADTIRSKTGITEPMNTVEMVEAIANIPSTTEMENATATEDKVLEGYTFYAGEGGLKTGNVTAESLGITADKILTGNTIMGVEGSAVKGATGTFSCSLYAPYGSATVNIGFKPSVLMLYGYNSGLNGYYVKRIVNGSASVLLSVRPGTTSNWGDKYTITLTDTGFVATGTDTAYGESTSFTYVAY